MKPSDSAVIGFFAYRSRQEVICTEGDACLVAGSERQMRGYVSEIDPQGASGTTIRKTRFGEILRGLHLGAAYAFDEEAYARFFPLAHAAGLPVEAANFGAARSTETRFLTVRLSSH